MVSKTTKCHTNIQRKTNSTVHCIRTDKKSRFKRLETISVIQKEKYSVWIAPTIYIKKKRIIKSEECALIFPLV